MEKFDFNDEFFALQDKYEKMERSFRNELAKDDSEIPKKILEIFREGDIEKLSTLARFIIRSFNTAEVGSLMMKLFRCTEDYVEKEAVEIYFKNVSSFCR